MTRVATSFDGGIARVQMQDAAGKNGLSNEFVAELTAALEAAVAREASRVLVLEGLSDVFCSGAPRELLQALARGDTLPHEIRLSGVLLDTPLPLIAAMQGHAVGGGLALGVCADIVLMSTRSRYGCNFLDLGFTPGMGVTRLLEHVLSRALSHELLFTGELRRGKDFVGCSGVNYVLPAEKVLPKALDLAARIAEKPRRVLEILKRTLSMPRRTAFEEARTVEALMHSVSFQPGNLIDHLEDSYVE